MDEIIFRVDSSEFEAAMRYLARVTFTDLATIWRGEVRTVVRKLIRFEYRANPRKVRADFMDRLVLLWDSGEEFNVPPERRGEFQRAPTGATRMYRERRRPGKKPRLYPATGASVQQYVKRVGYLASGWGMAAQQAGVHNVPQFVSRHNIAVNGLAIPGFSHPSGPRFYMANLANPRDGSRAKLEATLAIQAGAIHRSINAGLDRAFSRVRPAELLAA